MSDYISREAALKAAEHAYGEWNLAMAAADGARQINLVYKKQEMLKAVASVFDIVPAADVEPVRHGRWVNKKGGFFEFAVCSLCGEVAPTAGVTPKYCPACGAKVVWVNHNPEPYCQEMKDVPQKATAVYYREKWYWWSCVCEDLLAEYGTNEPDQVDDDIEITHWMPLPEPHLVY